jgi:SAM-dependent methyltransferase
VRKRALTEELYNLPLYYDVAFSWDLEPEIGFFSQLFREHVPFPVERILEPACGAGRFLVALPRHGYKMTGYDTSPAMLDYARQRVEEAGTSGAVTLVRAEMETAVFPREFDAALNSINSLGYLLEDGDIVSHFRLTGEALKPGGIYIVHIACAWDGPPDVDDNSWEMERDGVRVKTTWAIESEDRAMRRSHQLCTMEIDDGGEKRVLVDRHELRLWVYEEFRELVERSGTLELAAIYAEGAGHENVPLDGHINGEMGNLYYILRAV